MTAGPRPLIGIVGDLSPTNPTHRFTNEALAHADMAVEWVPTDSIADDPVGRLRCFDGLWIAPGSPYRSMHGALDAIRYARERGVPLVGTWGGFQHAIVEFARNVLGLTDADHEEYNRPGSTCLVISRLTCSLVGQQESVTILPGTRAARLYGAGQALESYACNYGVNPEYRRQLETGGMVVSGVGRGGETRIVELPTHPFFVATLFLPQARAAAEGRHPLIAGYAAAVSDEI